ncbi:heterokaryon incompatibility protein-domain-containing protein [Lophiotrema nucula]|uniref:Heterokaryon incompatibility protein-domain-containing protein n=1 Tax=Lophiotrema nucula TaxID=690887 RepID=A0A6A5YG20_9PLEO|nr:heterokaryon incompatibility protein-domain-containing protein [Lophiotrema nucula]
MDAVYKTLSLDPNRREIRLLKIITTAPQICCKLIISISLSKKNKRNHKRNYCALSYVWGDPNNLRDIEVNGAPHKITKNLAEALRNVQFHWARVNPNHEETEMLLWVDAICINQKDLIEKKHQIPLMGDIYASAGITFCSLSPKTTRTSLSLALDRVSELARRLEHNSSDDESEIVPDPVKIFETLHISGAGPEETTNETEQREARGSDDSQFDMLLELMGLPYWTRAWIFQELVLSKRLVFFYRNRSIGFKALSRVIEWAGAVSQSASSSSLPLGVRYAIRALCTDSVIRQTKYTRKILLTRKSTTDLVVEDVVVQWLGEFGTNLSATNPKDHVYALLGISGLAIEADYDKKTSVADVYITYCERMMTSTRQMPSASLAFLRSAGRANGSPGPYSLPTWVPNFPHCASSKACTVRPFPGHEVPRCDAWSTFVEAAGDTKIDGRTLVTTYLTVDIIEDISGTFGDSTAVRLNFLSSVFKMLRHLYDDSGRPYSNNHPFIKLASAFCQARIDWESPEVMRVARMFQLAVLTAEDEAPKDERVVKALGKNFAQQICCDIEEISDRMDSMGWVEAMSAKRITLFCIELVSMNPFKDNGSAHEIFADQLRHSFDGMQIARIAGGDFVIVPLAASIGDRIVLLGGYNDVCLIREERGYFSYIGPAGIATEIVNEKVSQARQETQLIRIR